MEHEAGNRERIPGQIRWKHVARSRAIRRIIERSIARWVELQGLGKTTPGGRAPRYNAVFQREGDGHLVHCQVEVVAGDRAWFGSWLGQGAQQAIADCLAHMSLRSSVLPAPQPLA